MSESKREKELKKLKGTIKTWESEFTKSHHRKPGKEDIQVASSEIKEAYKRYWTLKTKIEPEKMNKEDVWSEKLNKSYKGNVKIQTSDGVFKKYCNKIRERSSDVNQHQEVRAKEFLHKVKVINETLTFQKTGSNLSNQSLCDTVMNCDTTDLNNLEAEMRMKSSKKFITSNNVYKKVKSVNVFSSSLDLSHENNLSFDTSVNDEWLERCYNDGLNNSCKIGDSDFATVRTVSGPNSLEHFDQKIVHDEKFRSSPTNSLVNESFQLHEASYNQKCSEINSENIVLDEQTSVMEKISDKSLLLEKDVEVSHSCSGVNHSDSQATMKNDCESNIEEVKGDKKRKLTRTHTVNRKLSTHLERKMASGTLNENYVRVNIKKKKFSRGHRTVNVRKLKWQKWKELKKLGSNVNMSSSTSCFKCGQAGHWARNCKVLTKNDEQTDINADDFDDMPLPTLEEAAELAKKSKIKVLNIKTTEASKSIGSSNDKVSMDTIIKKDDFDLAEIDSTDRVIKPLYEATSDGKPIETPVDVYDALKELGYSDFRKGQETAIMRILSGLSTLVVMPTGSGKSLCYQLPAYIYAKQHRCITIVVSPLVSLMEDQITGLPSCLHAICLHSGMTDIQKKMSIQDLSDGKAQILLVSPEAVIGGLAYGSSMLPSNMPPISFACIDEVHCLSQWSHNFRPSYLQLHKVLTQRLNVKCILGLTATANKSTAQEIVSRLGFKSIEESVIGSTGIPQNLHLSVSRDKDKDRALIQLLTGDRFSNCNSIIIYCIRRDETERLATLIRTCLQDQISDEPPAKKAKSKSKKRNFKWTAEAYHAGLAPPRRRSLQKQFMTNKLRVIVATIAFGMGLDKRDVRAIIHFNMPKSFESYVQEIGRAGRDGLDSHCHLFLNNEGKDLQELQRFIYSNSTDRYVIRKLLKKVFIPCQCKIPLTESNQSVENVEALSDNHLQATCPKHEIAFSINDTVQELDLKEENISTLLCYMELHPKKWIEVLSPTYAACKIRCYGGPKQLRAVALKCPAVAAAFALDGKKSKNLENTSSYEFPVVEVASLMGWNTGSVKHTLKNLEWNDQKRKTGVIVEFSNLAFHLRAPCNLSADELDDVLDFLYEKVTTSEKEEIMNLKSLHSIFSKYSQPHYWSCCEEAPPDCSEGIKVAINKYFDETKDAENTEELNSQINFNDNDKIDIWDVRSQIRDIIFTNNDQNFTGRAIARIFHGIGSPCYPAEVWGRVRKFWRCLLHVNFNLLIKLANDELKKSK